MEQTFLCFESDAALFLVSLGLVYHIAPGKSRTESAAPDKDAGIPVMEACRLWGGDNAGDGEYIILLQEDDKLRGLSVSDVLGVCSVNPLEIKDIPQEARGERNVWLEKAVYLETLDRWAYILNERFMTDIKGL